MEYNVFKFKPSHINNFNVQDMQREEWEAFLRLEEVDGYSEWLEEKKRTITLSMDGEVISIMGVLPMPHGGGTVWLFLNGDVQGHGLRLATKCVGGALDGLKDMGYEWVQTGVRDDFTQGRRWAKLLGFKETVYKGDLMDNGTIYTYWTKVL